MADRSVSIAIEGDVAGFIASIKAAEAAVGRFATTLERPIKSRDGMRGLAADVDSVGRSAQKTDKSINQLTGRLRLMADVAAILGPALAPIGAVGVAGIAGLANQLGAAALAGGTAILAFQGVGTALDAVNKARIEPTAANLEAARAALAELSPAAQDLVGKLQELRPALKGLRDAAAGGLFPGVIEGLDELETRIPEVERILSNVGSAMGSIFSDAANGLASSEWDDFFDFLATSVPATLASLGETVGNLARGFAELWMAFEPLNSNFSSWLMDASASFSQWADGLSQTEGFAEFIDYVRTNGPLVADAMGSIAVAVIEIAEAAAPLGGPVLQALAAIAKVVAAIADSDIGTPIMAGVAALSLFSRGQKALQAAGATTWGAKAQGDIKGMAGNLGSLGTVMYRLGQSADNADAKTKAARETVGQYAGTFGKAAAGVGALAFAASGLADKMGVANTASLGLLGAMSGFKNGGALGAAAGGILDFSNALSVGADDMERFFRMTSAESGGDVAAEIEAITDEIAKYEAIMEDARGLDLGVTKLWSTDEAAEAEESVGLLKQRLEDLQLQQDTAAASARAAAGGIGEVSSSSANAADAMLRARDAAQQFSAELEALSGFFDKRASIRDYEAALDDFRKGLDETGHSFDKNLAKGRANEERLDAIGRSAIRVAENLKGIKKAEYVDKVVGDLRQMASNLNGPARDSVQKLIQKLQEVGRQKPKPKVEVDNKSAMSSANAVEQALKTVDKQRPNPKVTVDTSSVRAAVSAVTSWLNGIQDESVYITTYRRTVGGSDGAGLTQGGPGQVGTNDADGSIHEFYANGGMRPRIGDQQPQVRPYSGRAGITWSEEGSGPWEGFVSGHPAKRGRSRAITSELAERLGGSVEWYADGGVRGDGPKRGAKDRQEEKREDRREEMRKRREERRERKTERRHDEIRKKFDKQIDALDKMVDNTKQLQSTVAGNFLNDPFENNATLQGVMSSLGADTARANDFRSAARNAKQLGLDGGVFRALLASGNTAVLEDIDSRGDVRRLEAAWAARNKATANLTFGTYTGGKTIDHLNDTIKELRRDLRGMEKRWERATERGTRKGAREGTDHTRKRDRQKRRQGAQRGKLP